MSAKKLSEAGVCKVYKQAFKEQFRWDEILPDSIFKFLDVLAKARSCPVTLAMGSLLPLTSCLMGPKARICVSGDYGSPLNIYAMSVSAPGGGKSSTYGNIISPVVEHVTANFAINVALEQYTMAGIQRHQEDNKGYGLIVSDEGHRLLSAINAKQNRHEGERGLLSKMWGGRGDFTTLRDRDRGFMATSMSMCVLIQPEPLLQELIGMAANDGFLDRFLFAVSKPVMMKSTVIRDNALKIREFPDNVIEATFKTIFELHHGRDVVYVLNDEAQRYYDNLNDSYADSFNRQYDTSSGV